MKWLIYALIGYLAWRYLQRLQRRRAEAAPNANSGTASRTAGGGETMVRCDYCDLAVPLSEAVLANGRHYCSPTHRNLAAAASSPPPPL